VSSNVPVAQATIDEAVLPERVQEASSSGAAEEGLLPLSVGVGLGVLSEMLEEEVYEVVGANGTWNRERTSVRHGHDDGEVTLGARPVAVHRPRVRTADGSAEIPLRTYEHFADRDLLRRVVLERMLAGVPPAVISERRSLSARRSRPLPGRPRSPRCRGRSRSAPARRSGS